MNKGFRFIVGIVALGCLPALAMAKDKACLLEGSFTLMGQKIEAKDCMLNTGAPQQHFIESCKGLAEAGKAFGAPAAKLTWLSACPAKSQGICEGLLGAPMNVYYYKKDAQALADTQRACVSQGGKWKKG